MERDDDNYLDNPAKRVASNNTEIESLNERKDQESDGKTAFTLEKILEQRKYQDEVSEEEVYYDWG